jgi:hypothetical protein
VPPGGCKSRSSFESFVSLGQRFNASSKRRGFGH